MAITVRLAGDDDIDVLAGLRRAWNEENAGGPIDDDDFDRVFRDWCARERPTHRNIGVGRVLMQALIEWGGAAGMEHLRLAPSPLSRSFYQRLGFVPGAVVELDPPRG